MNEISSTKFVGVTKPIQPPTQVKTNKTDSTMEELIPSTVDKIDKFEASKKTDEPVTYTNIKANKKLEPSEIDALIKEADKATENLRKLVETLILKQHKNSKVQDTKDTKDVKQTSGVTNSDEASNLEAIKKAQLSISEDGEFGVNAVSDRLVDFAIAVSGGDKTKLETLKSAIDAGFAAAKEALGGTLPEISNQTYTETMRKLDEWSKSDL